MCTHDANRRCNLRAHALLAGSPRVCAIHPTRLLFVCVDVWHGMYGRGVKDALVAMGSWIFTNRPDLAP